jgi:hypothetical protein
VKFATGRHCFVPKMFQTDVASRTARRSSVISAAPVR